MEVGEDLEVGIYLLGSGEMFVGWVIYFSPSIGLYTPQQDLPLWESANPN